MLESYLQERKRTKELLLMTHLVVGYPSIDDNFYMLEEMQKADADVVELQFPFSEPTADGPLFVTANQESLDAGMTIDRCFSFMEKASSRFDMPLLMMGYYNPVFVRGEAAFCKQLSACGGKGLIVPDLPLEEASLLFSEAEKNKLDPILIITPNCSLERMTVIAEHSRGFIYCVARKGVTGKKTHFDADLDQYLQKVRSVTSLPLALGFGVSNQEDLAYLRGKADMAIMGTAALKAYKEGGREGLAKLLRTDQ